VNLLDRERLPTSDTVTDPSWMLQRRALVAAARAVRTQAQHVPRRVGTPSDDAAAKELGVDRKTAMKYSTLKLFAT
jgi:hypothetical protein